MSHTNSLLVAGATVVVAAGVYYGLNFYAPHVEEKGKLPATATVDSVFGATIQESPQAAPPTEPPASTEPAPAAAAPPPQAAATPAPAPEPAASAAPAVEPPPAPAAEPPPRPVKPKPKASPPKPSTPLASDAVSRWWGDPSKQDPKQLNVNFAGQAAGEKAIALLFSGSFTNVGNVAKSIKVLDAAGNSVKAGHWEISPSNTRMLVFRGISPGRYTVVLAPELADAQGKTLGRRLNGAVYVR
jgi:hypothetical protein